MITVLQWCLQAGAALNTRLCLKNYFNNSLNILNNNGIIVVDNVLWYGDVADQNKNDRLTLKIREFNKFIKDDNRVENLILPIGDGLSICRKI